MSINKVEQASLIQGCTTGNRRSQQRLFDSFYGKMLSVCMRYAHDRDQAKDILQEGFIKVFDNLGKFNQKGSLEGWIRRIMVNTAIDKIRQDKRSLIIGKSEELLDQGIDLAEDDFEEDAKMSLDIKDVVQAMQDLSPAYKMVFNLYVMENLTHREIAEKLGINEGTSKSNLAKAKMRLRSILLKRIDKV